MTSTFIEGWIDELEQELQKHKMFAYGEMKRYFGLRRWRKEYLPDHKFCQKEKKEQIDFLRDLSQKVNLRSWIYQLITELKYRRSMMRYFFLHPSSFPIGREKYRISIPVIEARIKYLHGFLRHQT